MYMKKAIALMTAGIMVIAASCAAGEDIPDDITGTAVPTETAPEDISDFTCRIKGDLVRIVKYTGNSTEVIFPDTAEGLPVKEINAGVFSDRVVTDITLPAAIENISAKSINNTGHLQNIYVKEGSTNYISENGILLSADGKTLVMYPGGREGEAVIPESVEKIGDNAFYGCKISSIKFPVTVTEIGISAFESCVNLHEITVPGNIEEISPYAFCGSGLESVTISEGVENIGTGAFESTEIMELYLPDSVKTTGNYILGSERGAAISADKPGDGIKSLEKYEKLFYRSETALNSAIRSARRMVENDSDYYYISRAYLTDIDGDNFPEMLTSHIFINDKGEWESPQGVYRYNVRSMDWELIIGGRDSNVNIYRDRQTGEYMQIGVGDYSETSDYILSAVMRTGGEAHEIGTATWDYPINGYYDKNEGYVTGFTGGGKFEIYEAENTGDRHYKEEKYFSELINSTVDTDRYEQLASFNFTDMAVELFTQYGNADDRLVICGEFDSFPDPEKAAFTFADIFDEDGRYIQYYGNEPEPDSSSVTVGDTVYPGYTYWARLSGDEITPENFEKLSRLPCLTNLSLSCNEPEDIMNISGIEKLEKLRSLTIGCGELRNSEILRDMDIQWLEVYGRTNDLSFMADLDKVQVLEIGYSMNRPDDFYSAVSGMDSLRYITVSVFEENITKEQLETIRTLRPDVGICYFKVG